MRFYFRYTGANCTIIDRASHGLIGFLDMKDKEGAKRTLTTLCNMTIEEYIAYCIDLGLKFNYNKTDGFVFNSECEEWANKAWIATTKRALKELGATIEDIPGDIVTIELVTEVRSNIRTLKANKTVIDEVASTKEEDASTGVNKPILDDTKKVIKKLNKKPKEVNTIDNDASTDNKPKKLSKKDDKANSIVEPIEDTKATTGANKGKKVLPKKKMIKKDDKPKYTKDILRSLLASKKIDVATYREEMKKLA